MPDPTLTAPHVSNRILGGFLLSLEDELGEAAVQAILAEAGLPRSYFQQIDGWVSHAFTVALAEAVAHHVHGLGELPPHDHALWQLWRQAGRDAMSPERFGALFLLVRALGSPRQVYSRFPSLVSRGNRTVEMALESLEPTRAVLSAGSSSPDCPWFEPLCWNLRGLLEAIPTIWGLPPARVRHDRCAFTPGSELERCVFEVEFSNPTRAVRLRALVSAGVGSVAGAGLAAAVGGPVAWGASLGGALLYAVDAWRRQVEDTRAQQGHVQRLEQLVEETDRRYASLWKERRELRRSLAASRKLSGYLAHDLVERILQDPELELTLGGRRTEAAVLFADIVGFTPRAEHMEPEDVVEELNLYFSHIDPAFAAHDGVIDKRMGDGIMGVFVPRVGEPPGSLHDRALGCALALLEGVQRCNLALAERGAAPFAVRVGLASGPLVQGNMGSEAKLEYTVIGDVVNLAARLEGLAGPGHVLLPQETLPPELPDGVREVGRRTVRVKGRRGEVAVVELCRR